MPYQPQSIWMYFAPVAAADRAAATISWVRSSKLPRSDTQKPGLIHDVSAMAQGGLRFSTR